MEYIRFMFIPFVAFTYGVIGTYLTFLTVRRAAHVLMKGDYGK